MGDDLAVAPAGVSREVSVGGYRVRIAPGALDTVAEVARESAPAHRYAVISDETVAPLYGPRIAAGFAGRAALLTVPAGEAHKSRETWAMLTDALIDGGFGRDSTIIALGGGMIGDLAGFVAATYMRGVAVIQVPTTLLAMVDASIGGKTAVDTPRGKNLVGAFHPPAAVVIDPGALATLPPDQMRHGSAEILKHGVIADEDYFEEAARSLPAFIDGAERSADGLSPLIARSVEIKGAVVDADERESGVRKTLNFGHTVGHALEAAAGYRMAHGAAVAAGMWAEARIAERLGIADDGTADRIERALRAVGLPWRRPEWLDPFTILEATRTDKKGRRGVAEYSLPLRIGAMCPMHGWGMTVEDSLVLEVLA
jgi:3-dehydroquinate synthase